MLGIQDCKPVDTPVSLGSKLNKASDEDECVDQKKYQSAIESLMYLSVGTRPDITYAVNILARFTSKPTKEHWTALKRLLHYLRGTLTHGILYTKDGSSSYVGYTDADWAGNVDDRKLVTYFCSVVVQSPGEAKSRNVLHCQLLKLSMLLWLVQLKNQSG